MTDSPGSRKRVLLAILASVLVHGAVAWLVTRAPVKHLQGPALHSKPLELVVTRSAPRTLPVPPAPPAPPAPRPKPVSKVVKKDAAPVPEKPLEVAAVVPEVTEPPAPASGAPAVAAATAPSGTLVVQPGKGTGDGTAAPPGLGVPGGTGKAPTRSQLMLDTGSALRFLDKENPPPKPVPALAAPEFVAGPFVARVRDTVASRWTPERSLDLRFEDGKLGDSGVSRSVVAVTIDRQGAIVQLNLVSRGKEDFLDELALAAVRASAPFINPPANLFGADGKYGFHVGVEITLSIPSVAEQMLGGPSLPQQALEFATTGKRIKTMCFRREKPCQPPACRAGDVTVRGTYEPCARKH